MRIKLSGNDAQKVAKTYTTNAEAYKLYLQGRYYRNKREEKDFLKASTISIRPSRWIRTTL
ncbi:MAG TPA: hypothetical protein VJ521_06075 [Acidobacteriota bacterium]|nr:hypothetical protein [Acidobacteriota bacterium]